MHYYADEWTTLYHCDVGTGIPLASDSVQCVVTSPPYWGLRDYGATDQVGLESSPKGYVAKLVSVFRDVRRVLRPDGTLWLNLGDTYAREGGKKQGEPRHWDGRKKNTDGLHDKRALASEIGLKPKDLVGIPWRVAFALRADGWYLRSDIIWNKTNPMPESVTDRPTKSHEYLFLLTKSPRYFYDAEAIEEPASWERWGDQTEKKAHTGKAAHLGGKTINELPIRDKKNKRSVWTITTQPYSEAHFATFPEKLVEPCILAGSREGDVVLDPFVGSGTTLRVAKNGNRIGVGMDINEEYLDMAKARIGTNQPMLI